jgi:hypothetical protein
LQSHRVTYTSHREAFYAVLGFEAAKLQPETTTAFLQALVKHFYFHVQKNFLELSLVSSNQLGSHSAVVYLWGNGGHQYRYAWAHPVHAPFGQPLPMTCDGCGIFGTARPPSRKKQGLQESILKVGCSFCDRVSEFKKPDDLEFRIEDGDGIWIRTPVQLLSS